MHVAVESSKAARGACTPTCTRTTHLRVWIAGAVIYTQQIRSTEKYEDVNWVMTNLRTGKNHSAERGDAPRKLYYNSAVSCMEALRNPHGIRTEALRNLRRIRRIV